MLWNDCIPRSYLCKNYCGRCHNQHKSESPSFVLEPNPWEKESGVVVYAETGRSLRLTGQQSSPKDKLQAKNKVGSIIWFTQSVSDECVGCSCLLSWITMNRYNATVSMGVHGKLRDNRSWIYCHGWGRWRENLHKWLTHPPRTMIMGSG